LGTHPPEGHDNWNKAGFRLITDEVQRKRKVGSPKTTGGPRPGKYKHTEPHQKDTNVITAFDVVASLQ